MFPSMETFSWNVSYDRIMLQLVKWSVQLRVYPARSIQAIEMERLISCFEGLSIMHSDQAGMLIGFPSGWARPWSETWHWPSSHPVIILITPICYTVSLTQQSVYQCVACRLLGPVRPLFEETVQSTCTEAKPCDIVTLRRQKRN